MFYQILLSPQVKRCAIITYVHGICELLHELPNGLRLRILENQKTSGNCLNPIEDSSLPSPLDKLTALLTLEENAWKMEIKFFPLCAISHKNY